MRALTKGHSNLRTKTGDTDRSASAPIISPIPSARILTMACAGYFGAYWVAPQSPPVTDSPNSVSLILCLVRYNRQPSTLPILYGYLLCRPARFELGIHFL